MKTTTKRALRTKVAAAAICVAAAAVGAPARAALTREQLDRISRSEFAWQSRSVSVPGYQGAVGVMVTDEGKTRLAQIPAEFEMEAALEAPLHRNEARFRDWCALTRWTFRRAKEDGNAYRLAAKVNPTAADALGPIENAPTRLTVRTKLALARDSNSTLDTQIRPADFEAAMDRQIATQSAQIARTGVASLDMTGWDDVACDLMEGKAQIDFAANMAYEPARVHREAVINGTELRTLFDEVQKSWRPQADAVSSLIGGSALLANAYSARQGKSAIDVGLGTFLGVHGQLFDRDSGALRATASSNFADLAMNLDRLSRDVAVSASTLHAAVSFKGRK